MKAKLFLSAGTAALLVGMGVLVGSVTGPGSVAAQTPAATASPTSSTTTPASPVNPAPGRLGGMHKGRGEGKHGEFGGGHDGLGQGLWGGGATAEGANSAITNTASLITLAKADLAYANGKMDIADVQKWLNGADTLLGNARSANSSSQFGQAVSYAHAARQLAMLAQGQMAQKLGAATLPSYSQLPQRGNRGLPANTALTQAQASRMLAGTYNNLVMLGASVKNASNSQATSYLTDAQNAYKAAYNSYQAGNYAEAVASAKLARGLADVAGTLVGAASAPANADTPATVPAPNF